MRPLQLELARTAIKYIQKHITGSPEYLTGTVHVYIEYTKHALSMTQADQVIPAQSYDPLLMSLFKSTSISVNEWEETG